MDRFFITGLRSALREKGYVTGPEDGKVRIDSETQAALIEYQRDNSFPIGQLDMETLRGLGLK